MADDKLNPKLKKQQMGALSEGIAIRSKAKMMEDEAATLKKTANEMIMAAAGILGIKKGTLPGVGTATIKRGTNTSINREMLTETLLRHGLDVDTVKGIVEEATKVVGYDYVEFKREK